MDSFNGSSGILNLETASSQELVQDRKKPRAFCQSKRCCSGKDRYVLYKVRGLLGYAVLIEDNFKNTIICPKCDYTVFWSREYKAQGTSKEIARQTKARELLK